MYLYALVTEVALLCRALGKYVVCCLTCKVKLTFLSTEHVKYQNERQARQQNFYSGSAVNKPTSTLSLALLLALQYTLQFYICKQSFSSIVRSQVYAVPGSWDRVSLDSCEFEGAIKKLLADDVWPFPIWTENPCCHHNLL